MRIIVNNRRLTISLREEPALQATRVAIDKNRLVYALVVNRRFKYPGGRSKVAYIGTTRVGAKRMAHSVATKADERSWTSVACVR